MTDNTLAEVQEVVITNSPADGRGITGEVPRVTGLC